MTSARQGFFTGPPTRVPAEGTAARPRCPIQCATRATRARRVAGLRAPQERATQNGDYGEPHPAHEGRGQSFDPGPAQHHGEVPSLEAGGLGLSGHMPRIPSSPHVHGSQARPGGVDGSAGIPHLVRSMPVVGSCTHGDGQSASARHQLEHTISLPCSHLLAAGLQIPEWPSCWPARSWAGRGCTLTWTPFSLRLPSVMILNWCGKGLSGADFVSQRSVGCTCLRRMQRMSPSWRPLAWSPARGARPLTGRLPHMAHTQRGVPFAVGGMGMISTANYIARQYGVRSAMPGERGRGRWPTSPDSSPRGERGGAWEGYREERVCMPHGRQQPRAGGSVSVHGRLATP